MTLLASSFLAKAESPFRFQDTPGRLPKDLVPLHYEVQLTPNLAEATFEGELQVQFEVRTPANKLVLNSAGLEITDATLVSPGKAGGHALVPVFSEKEEIVEFDCGEILEAKTSHQLSLKFRGRLNEKARGLYISRYQVGGAEKRALATQMEPSDCRRLFPCWDEPVFRATFAIQVTVPGDVIAVSNMPAASAPEPDGRTRFLFEKTPKMATYLVALFIGDFEKLEDEVSGTKLGIYVTPGKRAQAVYAMEATKKLLPYFNDYFGTAYPLPKLDQIALPSTGASGMENWGAILYNDNAFLYDPATSSPETQERAFAVIAHEIAHQWFGNLVTMAWWDNLWLNEGFASWMGTAATDHFNPEWKSWLRAASGKEWAMKLDARSTTHPIQQPVADESQALDAFDSITYQKGQAFIRMLEAWLGSDAFRAGLRRYTTQHAFSSTTTADLWEALEKGSGKPVKAFAAAWTEQPGFPMLEVVRSGPHPQEVTIKQERFTIHQKDAPQLRWQIPVNVAFLTEEMAVLLDEKPQTVSFPPRDTCRSNNSIIVNAGSVGYYRVSYDEASWNAIIKGLGSLPESDQLSLLQDTWALFEAGKGSLARHLDLCTRLAPGASPTVLEQIIGTCWALDFHVRSKDLSPHLHKWARSLLAPHFSQLGWVERSGESALAKMLRSSLIQTLGNFGDETVLSEAKRRFEEFRKAPASLPGSLRAPVLALVGRAADHEIWEQLHDLARKAESFELKRALYSALASATVPELAAQTLDLSLTDELIASDAAGLVQQVADEGCHPDLAWEFAKKNLEALLAKVTSLNANEYIPNLFHYFAETKRADELTAFARSNLPAAVGPSVAKAVDQIQFQAEFQPRVLAGLGAWLKETASGATPARTE